MLAKLTVKNYRGFKNHTIDLRTTTIVVGKNNAGKSTIVEAFRLVSAVVTRGPHLRFREPPEWLDIPFRYRGVSPSLEGFDFDFRTVCHRYGEPPANITAEFTGGQKISIYVHSDEETAYALFFDANRIPIVSGGQLRSLDLPLVSILPPVGPVAREERVLSSDYVRSSFNTHLAPIHFRNQLLHSPEEHYFEFVRLAEESWPSLGITSLEEAPESGNRTLSLLVRDGSFVAEIGWMGHGLQTWLQTIWFLARTPKSATIILDEPDVYLHADLQRKLVRLLRGKYYQAVIATHSVEMMSEVDPHEVLIVDKSKNHSRFADSIPAVQKIIENIGGVHNLQLSKFWSAKRCILIEGGDISFIKELHGKLYPDSREKFDEIPAIPIGGSGNWKIALGASLGLKNASGVNVNTYCILDRDYRIEKYVDEIKKDAKRRGLLIYVWNSKEIENYFICPTAIQRIIGVRSTRTPARAPKIDTINNKIDKICDDLRNDVTDAIASDVLAREKRGLKEANSMARKVVNQKWGKQETKIGLVSGKHVISLLSDWSKTNYGVSFGAMTICRELTIEEIHSEIKTVIGQIEAGKPI